ncbi:MAG: hypothetical protein IJB99_05760, partial [Clostridia bacterium]|nr:hypothetical protein [Clostridia bacterium]
RALKIPYNTGMSHVVLKAYQTWGADYPRHMEGAVMTAVIDRAEDRMIVARDRIGAIDVYYAWRSRSCAFASEEKLLLLAGVAGRRVGREGMLEMLLLNKTPTPGRTPFQDIRILEPGTVLIADARGARIKRYYSLIRAVKSCVKHDENAYKERYSEAIKDMLPLHPGAIWSGDSLQSEMILRLAEKSNGEMRVYWDKEYNCKLEKEKLRSLGVSMEGMETAIPSLIDILENTVETIGFPGSGFKEAYLFSALSKMKETERAIAVMPEKSVLSEDAYKIDTDKALMYLNSDAAHTLCADSFLADRRREMLDRLIFSSDSGEYDEKSERKAVWALSFLPAYSGRITSLCQRHSLAALSPLWDERVTEAFLAFGCAKSTCASSSEIQMPRECLRQLFSEALRISGDEKEPIYDFIDGKKIQKHVRGGCADINALLKLIQINLFFRLFEAEASI